MADKHTLKLEYGSFEEIYLKCFDCHWHSKDLDGATTSEILIAADQHQVTGPTLEQKVDELVTWRNSQDQRLREHLEWHRRDELVIPPRRIGEETK